MSAEHVLASPNRVYKAAALTVDILAEDTQDTSRRLRRQDKHSAADKCTLLVLTVVSKNDIGA